MSKTNILKCFLFKLIKLENAKNTVKNNTCNVLIFEKEDTKLLSNSVNNVS